MGRLPSRAMLARRPSLECRTHHIKSQIHMSARLARFTRYVVILICGILPHAAQSQTFRLSFPSASQSTPVTGRAYLFVARTNKEEPRFQAGAMRSSEPFFGVDVEALAPGKFAAITPATPVFPVASLRDLP